MADFRTVGVSSGARAQQIDEGLRTHMNKVYGTMSVGTLITFAAAWAIGTNPTLLGIFRDPVTLQPNILGYIVMFAPLIMVFAFGAMINRLSAAGAQLFFYVYAAVMGVSISAIFAVFALGSVATVFLITTCMFAGLSLWGYTTKKDISGWGSFLIMGVIGLIVASLINMWFQSLAISWTVAILGVLIFAGLTAYDTQDIKNEYLAHAHHGDSEWLGKSAIMGALRLYLDFINMFMFLLQLLGSRE